MQRINFNELLARKVWLRLHLALALSAGLIFALIGFTGSISVYREGLDELLNPQLVIENPSSEQQTLDRIIAAVRAAHPDRHGEWTLEMPSSPHGMVTAWFEKPRETFFERYAPLMVSVNPYTAEVVASRFWGQTLTTWLLDLHTQLLMGDTGWNIVGWCGLLLPISVLSGLYLWWPGASGIRSGFSLRLKSELVFLLLDLHRLIGLLSAPILLLLAVTGFNLSFPGVMESISGAKGMAHGATGEAIVSTAQPNDHPTLLEAAEFIALGHFPNAEVRRVTTPDGESGVYRINLRQKTEVNHRHPYTTVWVDRWSGHIKEIRNAAAFGFGEQLSTWIWPFHTGEVVGKAGRFCWFLAGQSLFFLYVSGLYRWLWRTGKVSHWNIKKEKYCLLIHSVKTLLLKIINPLKVLIAKGSKGNIKGRLNGWAQVVKGNFKPIPAEMSLIFSQIQTQTKIILMPLVGKIYPLLTGQLRHLIAYAKAWYRTR